MSKEDLNTLYNDTVNIEEVFIPESNTDLEIDIPNENDAEAIVEDILSLSKTKDSDEESVSDEADNSSISKGDDIIVDPNVEYKAKLFVRSAEMYESLKRSGNLPKGVSEPAPQMSTNDLLMLYSILKCKYKSASSSNGVAEECILALSNIGAKYFDGSGDIDTFNPDLSALPDDMSLKIERDPSLKTALKNLSGTFQSDGVKVLATFALSVTSLALSSGRRKKNPSANLSKALLNVDYK